jgi:TolA-binding protein
MKIKFIWMALLALSFTNLATAQIKDTDNIQSLKDQIKAISKEIESLVSKIDSTNIEAVAESLEDEVDALEDKLDNLGDRIEDAKPDSDDETSIQTDVTKTKKIRAPRRTKAFFHIGTGVNGLASNKTVSGEFYPEVNIGQSWFLELGYNFRTRIGGANSPVGFLYGYRFHYR